MKTTATRRTFLKASAAVGALLPAATARAAEPDKALNVVVWDERQPAQKQAYENWLGNAIADHLRTLPGLSVKSVCLDDPGQGLPSVLSEPCDVLIWWGHGRQAEISSADGQRIVARIQAGKLALIALHSAHWSTPFVEAMNYRSRADERTMEPGRWFTTTEVPPPQRYTVPKADAPLTPYATFRKFPDGRAEATLHQPFCCFPAYRNDGKPSFVRVLKPDHPIVAGVPEKFEFPHTEMYNEPFHVPAPDEVVLEERWESGDWFRSGMVWKLGKGRVFYFRPGHETYPIYKDPNALKVVANAVRWLATPG